MSGKKIKKDPFEEILDILEEYDKGFKSRKIEEDM